MQHVKHSLMVLGALLALALPSPSHAFRLEGAGAMSIPFEDNYKLGFGFGILPEFSIGAGLGLETGLISVGRKLEVAGISTSSTAWYVPLLLRFTLWQLSAGIGPSAAFSSGDTLWSLTFSLRWDLIPGPITFFIDPRYNLGLNKPGGSSFSDLHILAGLAIDL